ncbi:hypothetical protein D3C85_1901530 [compost metagenome]
MIQVSAAPAAAGSTEKPEPTFATYSVPADRSFSLSAMNMNMALLVASSPISTVRLSGITCTSSCEMRPRQ